MTQASNGDPADSNDSVNGVPLNIAVPSGASSAVAVQVTQLPTNGTLVLADGSTPVSLGESLTPEQTAGLRLNPNGVTESSQFDFDETIQGGSATPMAISLAFDPTTNSITPASTAPGTAPVTSDPSTPAVALTTAETLTGLAAPTDPLGSSDPGSNSLSAVTHPANAPSSSPLLPNPVANGDPPGAYNAVLGIPLDINVPSEAASPVTYQIMGLPTNGTLVLADGTTPVSAGESLTPAQTAGLRLKPNGVAQSSSLEFAEVIPGLPSTPKSISLPFDASTNSVTLATTTPIGPAAAPATPVTATAPSNPNAIVLENERPGTPMSVWQVGPGDDSTEIQGFTTSMSTPVGSTVQFKINNQTGNGDYQIQVYRLGYYGGDGATLVSAINHSGSPVVQPNPIVDSATGEVDAGNWSVTDSWAVPSTATSGVYVANVVDGSQIFQIPFVITNPSSTSDIVFQTDDETWQAYNGWGGANLYGGDGPASPPPPASYGQGAAFAVSYNRPIVTQDSVGLYAGPQDSLFGAEYSAIYWLEENGYDVSYISGIDTTTNGSLLLNHKIFMDAGHDEYWTDSQVANVEAAANAGVNLAFFSGNELFWQTQLSPSLDRGSTANRTLVTYKDTHFNQIINPSGANTGTFEDPRLGTPPMPGNAVDGELFQVDQNNGTQSITVPYGETQLRFWRNTSVANTAPGGTAALEGSLLGYEWDNSPNNPFTPSGLIDLSSTTVQEPTAFNTDWGNVDTSGTSTNNLVEYRDPTSGALVFGAGTVFWSWGLSSQHDNSPDPFSSTAPDPNVQQATVNLFADMGVQPQTLQTSLAIANQSTDTTPPTSSISNLSTRNVVEGQTVTVSGTASDSGGGVIGGVEVSTDGGNTWNPASGPVGSVSMNWTYSFTAPAPGTYTVESRAIDDSLNVETPTDGVSYTVTPSSALSLFSADASPTIADDPNAVEVGVKFTSATSGVITGVRFYKGSANTGTHVGNLWTDSGTLLATATFTNETASGWQQANFSSPVSISAGTTYIASYHTNTGDYADTQYYFSTYTGQTDGSLNAPGENLNGVFAYGATSTFPNNTSINADNYWVDVVFNGIVNIPLALGSVAASDSYTAGAAPTILSSGTTLSDTESASLVSASVSISGGLLTGDTLRASTSGTSIIQSYNATTGVLSLTGSDTVAHYQQVLESVSYSSSNSNPTNYGADPGRTVSWTINDGTLTSATQTTTVNVTGGPATASLFSPSATPATITANDPNAVDLGVKFQASTNGMIVGIRFYKGPQNIGTHIGDLWTTSGTLLATATFSNESAGGWQQVNFSSPVSITAGTTYIASYETTSGEYSADSNYFANSVTNGPLTAPSSSSSGGNGIFAYGSSNPFPNSTFEAENYWIDAVFTSPSLSGPALSNVAASDAYSAGAAATTLSSDTTVSDPESATLASATVSITGGLLTGDTLAASTSGTSLTESYNPSTGVLSLTGSDTLAHYQQVLDSVTYSSTNADPTKTGADPSRTVSWVVNDDTLTSMAQSTTINVSAGPPTASLFSPSDTPATITENDPNAVDLGVKFESSTNGTIDGIRFYKGPQNTGVHIGDLWASTGTLLASATFTNETASGWQQVNFSSPVSITAGTTYIASYETTSGEYSVDDNFFANSLSNGTLTAPSSSSSGGNGVYAYGSSNAFPNNTFDASNYWVDVAFSAGSSLFSSTATPSTVTADDPSAVDLGVKFQAATNGTITGIRFYKGPQNTGTHVGDLWSSSGALLASATFSNETANGWQQVNLAAPVSITAGTTYVASYHTDAGEYSVDANYFTQPLTNGPLTAPASSASGGNGVFAYGSSNLFPSSTFNASNYWVDVVFQPQLAT
jgi:hypothetical protein